MSGLEKLAPYRQPVVGDANAPPCQIKSDFTSDPREIWELVRIGSGRDVFIELRRKRS